MNSALARGATATIALQPVPPTTQPSSNYPLGSTIAGQRLILGSVPARVWFDIQVTGWAPENLRTVQVKLDSAGYSGSLAVCDGQPANGGNLFPATAPCGSNADCRAAISGGICQLGERSQCISRPPYYPAGGNICEPAFQDKCNPQYVLSDISGFAGVDYNISLEYRFAATGDQGQIMTDFAPSYLGTLVVDVPASAKGLYTIGFNSDPELTFLLNDAPVPNQIPIAALIPGQIDVSCRADDCNHNEILDWEEVNPFNQDCDRDGICNGFEIAGCAPGDFACADCNGNAIPDGCESDCNANLIADSCDIAQCPPGNPACADCDSNGVPDGCQVDCNSNQIADACDISACQPGNLGCADCNGNGSLDICEDGGCCLDLDGDNNYESCSSTSEASCQQLNGVWRGICNPCPTQNTVIVQEPGGSVFVHVIGQPVDCLAGGNPLRRGCQPDGPFYDPWKSDADASMCHNFGAPGHSIPADFFDPGSDVFADPVCLVGLPLGAPGFGEADTLIRRSANPFDRCSVPSATPVTVDIDVYALSLVSIEPITVTYNGGQSSEQWTASVDRSVVDPPTGALTVTKSYCNGGTYTSQLYVQPRFTFTKVGDPKRIRVLDTGLAGIPFVVLDQSSPSPWAQEADPNLGLATDACSLFHAGVSDDIQQNNCDCNANGLRDVCDIEDLTAVDCNRNLVPDDCDLSGGSSVDLEPANAVPDECDPGPQPLRDPTDISKTRFITFSVPAKSTAAGSLSAVRVRLVSLHHVVPPYTGGASIPFSSFEDQVRWVGPPTIYEEASSNSIPFISARLQCDPHYRDWTTVGILHVYGGAIVPSSIYEVETLAGICQGFEDDCTAVSQALTIVTSRWGDVELPYNPPSTATQPDFADVSALVNKFKSSPGAPIKARALLAGDDIFGNMSSSTLTVDFSFTHIAACVDAFRGKPYPFSMESCP